MKGEKTTNRVTFNLDKELHFRLKQLALDKNTNVTALLVKWVKENLEIEEMEQKKLNDY